MKDSGSKPGRQAQSQATGSQPQGLLIRKGTSRTRKSNLPQCGLFQDSVLRTLSPWPFVKQAWERLQPLSRGTNTEASVARADCVLQTRSQPGILENTFRKRRPADAERQTSPSKATASSQLRRGHVFSGNAVRLARVTSQLSPGFRSCQHRPGYRHAAGKT